MNNRCLWAPGAALILALAAGCATPPRADRFVAPVLGSTWIQQHQDSGSYGSGRSEVAIRMTQRTWEGQSVLGYESPQGTLIAMHNGNWLAQVGGDGKLVLSWNPPLSWDWPLEVGKAWTRQYKVKVHAQNREVPYEAKRTVEAHEDVTVPAGTFKAFRMRYTDTLGNDNVDWFSPQFGVSVKQSLQRTDKHFQGAGRRDSELKSFSAPSAQRY